MQLRNECVNCPAMALCDNLAASTGDDIRRSTNQLEDHQDAQETIDRVGSRLNDAYAQGILDETDYNRLVKRLNETVSPNLLDHPEALQQFIDNQFARQGKIRDIQEAIYDGCKDKPISRLERLRRRLGKGACISTAPELQQLDEVAKDFER